MVKDDYFVTAYRILDYLYGCAKHDEKPDMRLISPVALGIEGFEWLHIIRELESKEYILVKETAQHDILDRRTSIASMKITKKGVMFVIENLQRFPQKLEDPKSNIVYLDSDGQKVLQEVYRKLGIKKASTE